MNMLRKEFLDYITTGLFYDENRPGDHINYWTFSKLKKALEWAGFERIIKSRYGSSISPYMRSPYYFDKTHPEISLYADAVKL